MKKTHSTTILAVRSGGKTAIAGDGQVTMGQTMMKATARGEYDGGLRVALMAAATAYVVSPIDVIPEAALLVFGLVDDAAMIAWLAGTVLSETDRFLEWERQRDSILPGTVVP